MPRGRYELRGKRVGRQWVFWFVPLPRRPGVDVTVFVKDTGRTDLLGGG